MQYNGRLWLSLGKVTSDDRWNDYQEMGQHSFYVIWQTIPVTECSTWQSWWKYFGIPKGSQNTWKRRGHWEKISLPSPVKSWGKTAQKLHMWDCHTFLCHIWKDQCQCQALIAAPYQFIPAKSPTVKWTDVSVRWSRTLTAVVGRLVDMKKSPVQYVLLLSPYFFYFICMCCAVSGMNSEPKQFYAEVYHKRWLRVQEFYYNSAILIMTTDLKYQGYLTLYWVQSEKLGKVATPLHPHTLLHTSTLLPVITQYSLYEETTWK